MKCVNCNCGEYQTVEQIKLSDGKYYRQYCSQCDDEYFLPIIDIKHRSTKHRFNKSTTTDFTAITATMCTIFSVTYYILVNLNKFSTIYR